MTNLIGVQELDELAVLVELLVVQEVQAVALEEQGIQLVVKQGWLRSR